MRESKNALRVIPALILCSVLLSRSSFAFTLPEVTPGQYQGISILGSTVKIKGLVDQASKVLINQREISLIKDGSFYEEVIIPIGSSEITVTVTDKDGKTKTYTKKIQAKDNYLFLVGIADGTVNFVNTNEGIKWHRDNSEFSKGKHLDGKISYYLVGKIKGKYLIKSGLDTDKTTQDKLFSNIDPDKYYPIYGDNSTVVYDVNSQGRFYILVEWDKSGFTFGNYQTMFNEASLVQYNRTLYGGKISLESKGQTAYGEPKSELSGFVANINQLAGHSEFLATGGSLYYLRHRNISEGSEKVALDIRDKNSGMSLYQLPQKENIDYTIKYDEGRIIFTKPVLTVASSDTIISSSILEGNLVYIVVNYEYKDQEAFPINPTRINERTGGVRASQALGEHLRVGATYVQEQRDNHDLQIVGQDATVKIGNFTQLQAEFAQSNAQSTPLFISYNGGLDFTKYSQDNTMKGNARRFNLNSSLGEYIGKGKDFLAVSSYYQYIAKNFASTDTLFQAGTEKYGMELSHKLNDNDRLRFIAQKEGLTKDSTNQVAENQITDKRNLSFTGQWVHTRGKFAFTSEYQQKQEVGQLGFQHPQTSQNIAERVDYQMNNKTSLFLGQQITISGKANNQTSLGGTTTFSDNTQVQAQTAFGNLGNSIVLGLAKQRDGFTSTYLNYKIINSTQEGRSSSTSFGANTKVGKDATLKNERQFITSDQRGVYTSNLMGLDYQINPRTNIGVSYQRKEEQIEPNLIASVPEDTVSVNGSYTKPDKLTVNTKIEYRKDTDRTQQILADTYGELKITQDLFLSGEYEYSRTREPGQASLARIDKKQVGLAFRPVKYDWLNGLFKYIYLNDDRPKDLTSADGGFVVMNSTSKIYATEFAFDLPFCLQLVEKCSIKDEHNLSFDPTGIIQTPDRLRALLYIHRLNYKFKSDWEFSGEYRMLEKRGPLLRTQESGLLFEVARKIHKGIYLGAGYNFTNFTEDLTVKNHKKAKGFFFRIQGRY